MTLPPFSVSILPRYTNSFTRSSFLPLKMNGSLTFSLSLLAISILAFLTLIVKPHVCVALSKLNITLFSNFSVSHITTRSSAYSNSITLHTPSHKSPWALRSSGILNSILTLPSYPFNAILSTWSTLNSIGDSRHPWRRPLTMSNQYRVNRQYSFNSHCFLRFRVQSPYDDAEFLWHPILQGRKTWSSC